MSSLGVAAMEVELPGQTPKKKHREVTEARYLIFAH